MTIFIGIDPGLTGAIAWINNTIYDVIDMPIIANGKGSAKVKNRVHAGRVYDIVGRVRGSRHAEMAIERVSARETNSQASAFSLGSSYMACIASAEVLCIPLELVTPQTWKKHFKLPADKEICRAKAIELFPKAELHLKKHHNRAEALLIAKWLKDTQG